MIILSVDTTAATGSVALAYLQPQGGFDLLAHHQWQRSKSHSELATQAVVECFENAKRDLSELQALAVTTGPGSFTGVRVGLNLVRSLAYRLKVPIYAHNALYLAAFAPATPKDSSESIVVVRSAFRDLVYAAEFAQSPSGQLAEVQAPVATTLAQLKDWPKMKNYTLVTDLKSSGLNSLSTFDLEKLDLAQIHLKVLDQSRQTLAPISWENLIPLYIRASEAEEKLRHGLLRKV